MSNALMTRIAVNTLNYAADLIERHGWVQGAMYTPYGYCAIGAIGEAAVGDERLTFAAESAFERYLQNSGVSGGCAVAGSAWNDKPERTKDEVIQALRAAALVN